MISYDWLVKHGCELATNLELLAGIFSLSGGDPCPGCGCHTTCPAWREQKPEEKVRALRSSTPAMRQTSKDGRNCPRCGSPVNVNKARRRYVAARPNSHGYLLASGLRCACGTEFD